MKLEFSKENKLCYTIPEAAELIGVSRNQGYELARRGELPERFLKAMDQAEEFIIQHPEEAKSIAKKRLNLNDDEVSNIWARNQFSLSLDRSLIAALEDETRWLISNNLTTEKQIPNFNDYIYEDALKAIKPEVVNIIR
jgi:NitT/TauT family transport system substrate-binding protein